LKLECDEPLSDFAFKFNVRRYMMETARAAGPRGAKSLRAGAIMVGRCRFTVSKPELKARLVSALETKM
jgi:hypothetical protein